MILQTRFAFALVLAICLPAALVGQQATLAQQGLGNVGFFGGNPGPGPGAPGGAANADFDSLIDLIQSTVEYDSWMENGTGEGEIQPFPTGVYADPEGTLRFSEVLPKIDGLRRQPDASASEQNDDVRKSSSLRYVSLPRLERVLAEHQSQGKRLPAEVLTLAGLQEIKYVFVNPKTRDLILAGPAGNWQTDRGGMIVSSDTGQPVIRLDDLLTLWRRDVSAPFGCSITPRQQALAATQDYLARSAGKPLEPSDRGDWLAGLRDSLGKQDVEFFGAQPADHIALVLLVADYHMKLIGMGLAESVEGVTNYLDTVQLLPDGSAPPMSVLRWWFAMQDRVVKTDAKREVFELPPGGVQVLSENELLAARGQRVHTNQSDDLNRKFAESFTAEFPAICNKYPLYGELKNVFDLTLVVALIERENLLAKSGWQPTIFENSVALRLPRLIVPREVETVVNHRVIDKRHIIAGISGGVWVDAKKTLKVDTTAEPVEGLKLPSQDRRWWWD